MNRRLILLISGCVLIGLVLGAAWPPPPIPRSRAAEAEWTLPTSAQLARYSPEDSSQVTRAARWGGEGGGPTGTRGNWRLAGFVNDPEPAALILPQAATAAIPSGGGTRRAPRAGGASAPPAPAERAIPGDALPDGSRLIAIEGDTITTELDGCRLVYQLYRPQPVSASPACTEAADAAAPRKTE